MTTEAKGNAGKHGSYGYATTSACGCEPCHAAVRAYHRRRRRMRADGTWPWEDAEPVKRHILELLARGNTWANMERLSGVSQNTIKTIIHGDDGVPRKRVRADVARLLLAVVPEGVRLSDPPTTTALVSSEPYHKMIQEIMEAGISRRRVALAAGHTVGPGPTYYEEYEHMTVEVAIKIERLHWAAWLKLPKMREICRCEVPPDVLKAWRREE